jgi:Skp family chaperone for outer membrane proteins
MKKSITFLCSVMFLFCVTMHAQDKIIGEKGSKGVIGEKSTGIIGEKGQQAEQARMIKVKNEINSYFNDYMKKQAAAESAADELRKKLQQAMKQLEASDRMGNFEIQRLMSEFNQAETLSSQLQKKREETKNAVISKI